jgi:hypothetical protein
VKLIILSLRSVNGKSILSFDLTASLSNYFDHTSNILEIKLPTGTIYLNKWSYLNSGKIYQSPKDKTLFFMVFGYKRPCQKWALQRLLDYSRRNKIKTIVPKERILAA